VSHFLRGLVFFFSLATLLESTLPILFLNGRILVSARVSIHSLHRILECGLERALELAQLFFLFKLAALLLLFTLAFLGQLHLLLLLLSLLLEHTLLL